MNVYWEMTQACALACRHCRAEAISTAHPKELNFKESVAFLLQIPEFGEPLPQLILTGGDPLARIDLYDLIDEARKLRIGVSITPAATPALTRDVMLRLKQHGVERPGIESRWFERGTPRLHSWRARHVRPHHPGPALGTGTGDAGAGKHLGRR